jgi:hypothetical protein
MTIHVVRDWTLCEAHVSEVCTASIFRVQLVREYWDIRLLEEKVIYQSTRRNMPEGLYFHQQNGGSLKFLMVINIRLCTYAHCDVRLTLAGPSLHFKWLLGPLTSWLTFMPSVRPSLHLPSSIIVASTGPIPAKFDSSDFVQICWETLTLVKFGQNVSHLTCRPM